MGHLIICSSWCLMFWKLLLHFGIAVIECFDVSMETICFWVRMAEFGLFGKCLYIQAALDSLHFSSNIFWLIVFRYVDGYDEILTMSSLQPSDSMPGTTWACLQFPIGLCVSWVFFHPTFGVCYLLLYKAELVVHKSSHRSSSLLLCWYGAITVHWFMILRI